MERILLEAVNMIINIEPEIWRSKTGWLARVDSLNLCAFGASPEDAVGELVSGIKAWCRSAEKANILVESLQRAGLVIEETDGPVEVIWPETAINNA